MVSVMGEMAGFDLWVGCLVRREGMFRDGREWVVVRGEDGSSGSCGGLCGGVCGIGWSDAIVEG